MRKIYIEDETRTGRTATEAAPLFLEAIRNLSEEDKEVRLIVPSIWSWAGFHRQLMRFNMFELNRKLVEAVGDQFKFKCDYCEETKELSITVQRC